MHKNTRNNASSIFYPNPDLTDINFLSYIWQLKKDQNLTVDVLFVLLHPIPLISCPQVTITLRSVDVLPR